MYGGAASTDISDRTTHVVVIPADHSSISGELAGQARQLAGQPRQLLGQILKDHGGLPALKNLHRRLHALQAHIVTQR